jgi:hypothetical protein
MRYYTSTRTFNISTSLDTNQDIYLIEVSLSDTFAKENIFSFTVKVLPKIDSLEMIIPKTLNEEDSVSNKTSNTKEKKK